jgi:hypothetical protein
VKELREEGVCGKTGRLFDKDALYSLLNTPIYQGLAVHRGES